MSESTTDVKRSELFSIMEDDFASSESELNDMARALKLAKNGGDTFELVTD